MCLTGKEGRKRWVEKGKEEKMFSGWRQ